MSTWPVRPRDLARITSLYAEMDDDRGRVLIVCGAAGSGRTLLLRAATEALRMLRPPPVVVSGRIASQEDGRAGFVTWDDPPPGPPVREALALVQSALGLGGLVVPLLQLLVPILGASRAARDLVTRIRERGEVPDRLRLVSDLLRAAANERPCVCLIDDSDKGAGSFWRDLEFSFAAEIARDLPLLLVLAIQDSEGASGGQDEADAQRMSRQLQDRGLADQLRLEAFTSADLRDWIGSVDTEVAAELLKVTWGQAGLVASVWTDWTRSGSVAPAHGDGRWVFTPAADEAGLGSVSTSLRVQLERVVTDFDRDVAILRCGAVEGRRFTAECVGEALGRGRDEVNDALHAVLERQQVEGKAIIENCGGLAFSLGVGGQRELAIYRFVSPWHWLALRAAFSEAERKELASRLADALVKRYEPEIWRVARSLAELSRMAARAEAAARYQRIADFGGPDDELSSRAEYLVSVDVSNWDPWECERAGYVLLEAISQLRRTTSFTKRRAYAGRAHELGARARNGPLQVRGYILEAESEIDLAEFESARDHLKIATRMAADVSVRQAQAEALLRLGSLELGAFAYAPLVGQKRQTLDPRQASEAGEAASRAALLKFQILGDVGGQAQAHTQLAHSAIIVGDWETAGVEHQAALDLRRREGDDRRVAIALLNLAHVKIVGLREDATEEYREALELKRATADRWNLQDLFTLVSVAVMVGDRGAAREHVDEMVQLATLLRDPAGKWLVRRAMEWYATPSPSGPSLSSNSLAGGGPSLSTSRSTSTTYLPMVRRQSLPPSWSRGSRSTSTTHGPQRQSRVQRPPAPPADSDETNHE